MNKFKAGDKVVVNGYGYHYRIGFVTEVIGNGYMVDSGKMLVQHTQSDDESEFHLFFTNSQVDIAHSNTLQVGQTYTSENGNEWDCIAANENLAWLKFANSDTDAYLYKIDGTNISQGGGSYNIKWGPKRETVTTRFSIGVSNKNAMDGVDNHVANITFDLIDGTPDWTTAKVTPCD